MDDKILAEFNKLSDRKKESLLYALRIMNRPTPELVQEETDKINTFPRTTEKRISKLTINELNHISDNNLHKKDEGGGGGGDTISIGCEYSPKPFFDPTISPRILILGLSMISTRSPEDNKFAIGPEFTEVLYPESYITLTLGPDFASYIVSVWAPSVEWLSGGPGGGDIKGGKKGVDEPDIPHISGDIEMYDFDPLTNIVYFRVWGESSIFANADTPWSYIPGERLEQCAVTFHYTGEETDPGKCVLYIERIDQDREVNLLIAGPRTIYITSDITIFVIKNSLVTITSGGQFASASGDLEVNGYDELIVRGDGTVNWVDVPDPDTCQLTIHYAGNNANPEYEHANFSYLVKEAGTGIINQVRVTAYGDNDVVIEPMINSTVVMLNGGYLLNPTGAIEMWDAEKFSITGDGSIEWHDAGEA